MKYRNIRSIREDNDMTQVRMAELLNISQNNYSQYVGRLNGRPGQYID